MPNIDVTIRGAGAFGLCIAYVCARRGAKVKVIDPKGPGAGSSGGVVGALAPHVPENWNEKKEFQFLSLIAARTFWPEVEEASGFSTGYGAHGRVQPLGDGAARDLAAGRGETARELWRGLAAWELRAGAEFGPLGAALGGEVIFDSLSARLYPRLACEALVEAGRRLGVRYEVEGAREGAEIWATGYEGLEAMSAQNRRAVGTGIKGQAALIDAGLPDGTPQFFADGVHFVPHQNGTLAIGSTTEREFDGPTGTDAQLDALLEKAYGILPDLRAAPVILRWAGVRPRSRSRAPMLGRYVREEGAYVANGGFKIGFGMAPKVAEVMADLVLEGRDAIPDGFRVEANL